MSRYGNLMDAIQEAGTRRKVRMIIEAGEMMIYERKFKPRNAGFFF
jgi:hypothetical protein